MAKTTLPTNYVDDVLNGAMDGKRRYREIPNADGTISLEDATTYDQIGNNFGASQLNLMNDNINQSFDANKMLKTMDEVNAVTQEGYGVDALVVKELNSNLSKVKTYVGEDGKLHFIDSAGADSVLPFSGGWEEIKVVTLTSNLTIDIGRKPKELFVGWSGTNVTTSEFNLFSYYNEDFTSYSFGAAGVTINDNGFTITCKYSGRPVFYAYR